MEVGIHTKISVRWPITIISEKGTLEVESRNITLRGVFIKSQGDLRNNDDEIFQMIIRGPRQKSVLVKGKMVWANSHEKRRSRSLSGGDFFFVKVVKEDREILRNLISEHLAK